MPRYLVVAAASAVGQAVVKLLHARGDEVVTTARNADKITPNFIVEADNFDAMVDVFNRAGPIDGVVNCAGSLLIKSAHATSYEEFKKTIDASLTSSFAVVRAAGKTMTTGGAIVLISSAAALTGLANHEAIAAAKAGVIGLAHSAAATYASLNLRVNVVAPGMVKSPLTAQLLNNEFFAKASAGMHALGRIGTPEDIAQAVVFFLDPINNWITGQVLAVDGGLSSIRPKLKV